jgi:hypothetical protein
MLDYDNESRLQLAREHAERLADDMRRTRRLTPDAAGHPLRAGFGELLRGVARLGRKNEAEPSVPAYDA